MEELTKICDELIAKLGTTDWEDVIIFSPYALSDPNPLWPSTTRLNLQLLFHFFESFFHESGSVTGRKNKIRAEESNKTGETYFYGLKSADVRLFPYCHNPLLVVYNVLTVWEKTTHISNSDDGCHFCADVCASYNNIWISACFDTWLCNSVLGFSSGCVCRVRCPCKDVFTGKEGQWPCL